MASDMVVHTWEAPSQVESICVGQFLSGQPARCAFAQQGGLTLFEACSFVLKTCGELHVFDKLESVHTISLPGNAPFSVLRACLVGHML